MDGYTLEIYEKGIITDDNNYLKITDRKKDIIVNLGGDRKSC